MPDTFTATEYDNLINNKMNMLQHFLDDFLQLVPLQLPKLLDANAMEEPQFFNDYVLLHFPLNEAYDLEEIMDMFEDDMELKNITTFEFSKYTPTGQDFSFSVEMRKEKISSLISNINDYYQSFDPDYETYLWIGTDGHGKNGAPYHIKDIVKDMEAAEDMIWELHNLLFNELL